MIAFRLPRSRMPLPSELIERLSDPQARRELGRVLDGLVGAEPFKIERGVWTPAWTGLTVVGAPTYAGRWTRIGRIFYFRVEITAGGANTTASTYLATLVNNLPLAPVGVTECFVYDGTTGVLASGVVASTGVYTPTWAATNANKFISGWYEI